MAKKKTKKVKKVKLEPIKILAVSNSWEFKKGDWFFKLGQQYPYAYLHHSNEFGWMVFNRKFANLSEFNEGIIDLLKEKPEYAEGQDFEPEYDCEDDNLGDRW